MHIARVDAGSGPLHARLEDDHVVVLSAAPWDGGRPTREVLAREDMRLLAPVVPSKIVAIGRNYRAHVEEMGYDLPDEPSIFLKPPSAIIGPGQDVVLPTCSSDVEHEAELALVIGRRARHLSHEDALGHVAGVTAANDVSARDLQRRDGSPVRAKAFDTFCPLGPWVSTDRDLRAGLTVTCRVDGRQRQRGHTSDLVFGLSEVLVRLTRVMTLLPGDVVLTGSPGGSARLAPGDRVAIGVEGVGVLEHGVVEEREARSI